MLRFAHALKLGDYGINTMSLVMYVLTLKCVETIGYSVHHEILGFKLMTWLNVLHR